MEEKDIHKEHRKRLRERFDKDPGGFTKHELLELLLFYAIPRRNVNPVAHKLLAKYGSVKNVLRADGKDLAEVDGIGESAATYLNLIGKLLDVVADEKQDETKIYRFDDIKIYLLNLFKAATAEQFCAIYLSKNERILFKEVYTDNDKNGVSVDMIPFSRSFSNVKPYAVVIAHNHPSGNPAPSVRDDTATEKLAMLFSLNNVRSSYRGRDGRFQLSHGRAARQNHQVGKPSLRGTLIFNFNAFQTLRSERRRES